VQLVAAFATRADLLILDEPTAGLDPLMEMSVPGDRAEADRGQTVSLLTSSARSRRCAIASASCAKVAWSTKNAFSCGTWSPRPWR
jgi:ABC-2 type transport system ATP-binding protein